MINLIVNNLYILEEYVVGSLHSTEVVVVNGEVRFFATTTRYRSQHNELLETAYTMPAGLEPSRQVVVEKYVRDVFKAVGIEFGLYHVELIYGAEGPCLVEINGRMMGGVGPQVYQALTGQDAMGLLTRLHLGENVKPSHGEIKGAAIVILIGAKQESVVSRSFTQDGLDALLFRYGITFCTLKLAVGVKVRKFEGNLSVLGHVIVPAADAASAMAKGHEFLVELEELLGFPVSKYTDTAAGCALATPLADSARSPPHLAS
jgi:biotin carboxylase